MNSISLINEEKISITFERNLFQEDILQQNKLSSEIQIALSFLPKNILTRSNILE